MDFQIFSAGINDEGKRIDKILRILVPKMPLSDVYKLIRKKMVKVNGVKVKEDYRICRNDEIEVPTFIVEKFAENEILKQNCNFTEKNPQKKDGYFHEELKIVFENQNFLVIDKPYDVSVHNDENSLEKKVEDYFSGRKSDSSLTFKSGPLHRLDKKTTGLITFSLSLQGARWFSKNIQNHSIKKTYFAVLEGRICANDGRIGCNNGKTEVHVVENIYKTEKKDSTSFRKKSSCSALDSIEWNDFIENSHTKKKGFYTVKAFENQSENAKIASMTVEPLEYGVFFGTDVTFAKIVIKTGRKHQIRAQSALHGHPLLGDAAYGSKINLLKVENGKNFGRDFFLHAGELKIPQNTVGLPEKIKIPLPNDFIFLLKTCGIEKTDI